MPAKKTTKEELLVKTAQAFREKGYSNTSISDLSKICGIYNAHFYYYFKDKEELMSETLKYVRNYFLTNIINIAYDESIEPKERLEKMLDKVENFFLTDKGGCLMGNTALEISVQEPKFLEVVKEFFMDWMNSLTHLYKSQYDLETAREKAEITIQDVEGGIMMYKLYLEKRYILNALNRAKKNLS